MSETPLEIAIIYGSTRPERLCSRVVDWAQQQLANDGDIHSYLIDPADMDPLALTNPAPNQSDAISHALDRADAFIIVTPEYNHGYPAPLKALIDGHTHEWRAKPVSFISYGGITGGILAIEQLRTVLACLNAVPLRDGVMFPHVWKNFADDGSLQPPEAANKAIAFMLERLKWWALGLRQARQDRPFPVQHPSGL